MDEHRKAGDLIVLVSGGPTPLVQRIAKELGADIGVGTDVLVSDGRYTGKAGVTCPQ
ncbi:MAG: haloacid dehalogenase-like hydrolase [Chloroflexi bacterium]|nr:haloacid dehalogenase-like hydrolase [Chloroflexota bacterium]